jgi:hypothetical protein
MKLYSSAFHIEGRKSRKQNSCRRQNYTRGTYRCGKNYLIKTFAAGRGSKAMQEVQPPLDPRKYPWHRGDVITNNFTKKGFVLGSTPEYLEVLWMTEHSTQRLTPREADDLLRVAHGSSLSATGDKTNLEALEAILALNRIKATMQRRMTTIKTKQEEESVNLLIARSFDKSGCGWDIAHREQLFRLAVEPSSVGMIFKAQERLHRLFCRRH